MYGDFDEDEYSGDDEWWFQEYDEATCPVCGAESDENCYWDCDCNDCLGLDDED